jgi:hypothetical protein
MGFLVRKDQLPSPVYFSCDFYNVHANLLPLRANNRSQPSGWRDDLVVNPSLYRLARNEITPKMRQLRITNPFHADRSWFSIDDVLSAPVFYSYVAEASEIVGLLLQVKTEIDARRRTRKRASDAAQRSLVERR